MSKVRLAVYGTLRKGSYNFDRMQQVYGEENVKHVKTVIHPVNYTYALIPLNAFYPGLVETTSSKRGNALVLYNYSNETITFDILEVSAEAAESIKYMEEGSGYKQATIQIEGEELITYLYKNNAINTENYVKDGDWIAYEKSSEQAKYKAYNRSPFEEREI